MKKNSKAWFLSTVLMIIVFLAGLGAITVYIDPFFHYHKPLDDYEYPINNERYQNNGIVKFFEYDAIITGTSMTENFKTSELDALFDVNSIKVPYSGGLYKEINETVKVAIEENDNIKVVVRALDMNAIILDKDEMKYEDYPSYLYDDKLLNDVNYILNKEILINNSINVMNYTKQGGTTTDFDSYARWSEKYKFGKKAVDKTYTRASKSSSSVNLSQEEKKIVHDNIEQNVLSIARDNPNITFYYFFSPYSIYWWDSLSQGGKLERQLEAEKYTIEMLLECDNIKLFSFNNNFDLICDLNNYKDIAHYSGDVNSSILEWMKEEDYLLTKENYEDYCMEVKEFYMSYEYDGLFEEE